MVTCVPVFATHLAVKEIEAWRGVETKVGAGCPISGGARWSSGFPAGRWGDSGDPVLSLVLVAPPGFPAGCQRCHLPVTMMPLAKTLSQPPPHVSGLCHVVMEGGWRGMSLYFCSCQAVFGSSVSCLQPGAWLRQLSQLNWPHLESAVSLSEPRFLRWVTERSLGVGWEMVDAELLCLQQAF